MGFCYQLSEEHLHIKLVLKSKVIISINIHSTLILSGFANLIPVFIQTFTKNTIVQSLSFLCLFLSVGSTIIYPNQNIFKAFPKYKAFFATLSHVIAEAICLVIQIIVEKYNILEHSAQTLYVLIIVYFILVVVFMVIITFLQNKKVNIEANVKVTYQSGKGNEQAEDDSDIIIRHNEQPYLTKVINIIKTKHYLSLLFFTYIIYLGFDSANNFYLSELISIDFEKDMLFKLLVFRNYILWLPFLGLLIDVYGVKYLCFIIIAVSLTLSGLSFIFYFVHSEILHDLMYIITSGLFSFWYQCFILWLFAHHFGDENLFESAWLFGVGFFVIDKISDWLLDFVSNEFSDNQNVKLLTNAILGIAGNVICIIFLIVNNKIGMFDKDILIHFSGENDNKTENINDNVQPILKDNTIEPNENGEQ